jgi:cystathionine beta-synthase/cysteine synthase A
MRCETIVDAVGGTPLVRVNRLTRAGEANLWVKLECLNPGGSVKVRPAVNMVRQAARDGRLAEGGALVEATSGNLGIALSMVGAALGHPVKIMVDPRTPAFSVRTIAAYGAEATLVDTADEHGKYQIPRIRAAEATVAVTDGAFMPNQWANPDNPAAHAATAAELLADLDGRVDAVVCTTSSCGQVTGIGRALKAANPDCLVVAVDGRGSTAIGGPLGSHLLVGLGSGFTPDNFDASVIDHAYWCGDAEAFNTCRLLASREGMLLGGSSGAAVFVALRVAQLLGPGRNVVAVAPDGGDRYLDTVYDDAWWDAKGVERYDGVDGLRARLADHDPVPGTRLRPWRRYPAADRPVPAAGGGAARAGDRG